uniref:50S ribosomal protein L9, chloroplastic n=1 Tax=Laurencieae sp. TaxID=2007162 RepID=A0A1Z1M2Z6_9FLOR|nr:ribosomal protein L9 [Laurencieae sp.]
MKKKIQIIIKKSHFKQQKKGAIIEVLAGYAFNYLIPNGIAEIATKNRIKHYQMFSAIERETQEANSIVTQKIKNIIEQIPQITIYKKLGDNNLIFGSIKEKEIVNWIYKYTNLKVEKKQIKINNINQIGINFIEIQIKQDIIIRTKLYTIPSSI